MPTNSAIVGDAQIDEVIAKLKELEGIEREIEIAQRAGIDVTEARKQAQESRARLLQIKGAYAPGRLS